MGGYSFYSLNGMRCTQSVQYMIVHVFSLSHEYACIVNYLRQYGVMQGTRTRHVTRCDIMQNTVVRLSYELLAHVVCLEMGCDVA